MSQSPLDAVQTLYGAFGRGDIAAILETLDTPFEWTFRGSRGLPYTRSCSSREDVGQWFGQVAAVDDIQVFEPREFLVADNRVTVLGFERTIARPSGKEFSCEWVHVFTFNKGKLQKFWGMYDTEASANAR